MSTLRIYAILQQILSPLCITAGTISNAIEAAEWTK